MQFFDAATEVPGHSPYLAITGRDHYHLVSGLQQCAADEAVGLSSAHRDQHVARVGLGVERRNSFAQQICPVDLGIKELRVQKLFDCICRQQFTNVNALDRTIGEVVFDSSFKIGLKSLKLKIVKLHIH